MLPGVSEALRSRPPGALRALDRSIIGFALWTLGANAAVLSGLGLDAAAVIAALLTAAGLTLRSRRSSWFADPASALVPPLHPSDRGAGHRRRTPPRRPLATAPSPPP